eukprot:TRINITY_DN1678_c1_g1_i1.p1 TRINITY_DN1678_c1_g1~~TRINITY_DN1678_c1_g1_i1.p1  ORF type:complete len:393 (+),score=112.81 TRINITY_DN1678_c1_g1_i1:56-1180(+)
MAAAAVGAASTPAALAAIEAARSKLQEAGDAKRRRLAAPAAAPPFRADESAESESEVEDAAPQRRRDSLYRALEARLKPMRQDMAKVAAKVAHRAAEKAPPGRISELVRAKIYVGDATAAKNKDLLRDLKVGIVVNCSPQEVRTGEAYYGSGVRYIELWRDDMEDVLMLEDLACLQEAMCAAAPEQRAVFLHCGKGKNRSVVLALALQLCSQSAELSELSAEEAVAAVWRSAIKLRGTVLTNESFQRQLLLFARLGLLYEPKLALACLSPDEQTMCQFRALAEAVARRIIVCGDGSHALKEHRQRAIIWVRDMALRWLRQEKLRGFELASSEQIARAVSKVEEFARLALRKNWSGRPLDEKRVATPRGSVVHEL